VRGVDQRVLRSEEVVGIVALNCLVEKRQAKKENDPEYED
jgi:hypothetical protein